ncbi:hypothetical protein LguiA_003797 [Lonicera macranthoides]
MDPGPQDRRVLYLQEQHRSSAIWAGNDPGLLDPRRSDTEFNRADGQHIILPARVQQILLRAGFYGVYRVGHIQYDHALISAMVERWRQETHTFHLPVGECSITLQDVAVLLGLPIDGLAVTAPPLDAPPADVCERVLGIRPTAHALRNSKLKLSWIAATFREIPADNADDVVIERYARAWIIQSLGGSILADKSSAFVKVSLFPLLHDLNAVGHYSWGAAALAVLYREMCRGCRIRAKQIAGPLLLLQLWCWERFSHIRPRRVGIIIDEEEAAVYIDRPPHGARWRARFLLDRTPIHVLTYYRDQLDRMRAEQVIQMNLIYD